MYKYLSLFLVFSLFSCIHGEEMEPSDDNELITTFKLVFTPQTVEENETPLVFYWRDTEGDGVVDRLDPIVLNNNTQYDLQVQLFDETKSPRVDITKSIIEEADVHLFVYKIQPASLIKLTIKDRDSKGLALGLRGDVKTGAKGNGKMRVLLKHQPPVNGQSVKNGLEEPGSTDVDIEFILSIK
ncbi:MAG: hypothetical protein AABZ56_01405 [Bacteroidota bacterium]